MRAGAAVLIRGCHLDFRFNLALVANLHHPAGYFVGFADNAWYCQKGPVFAVVKSVEIHLHQMQGEFKIGCCPEQLGEESHFGPYAITNNEQLKTSGPQNPPEIVFKVDAVEKGIRRALPDKLEEVFGFAAPCRGSLDLRAELRVAHLR